MRNQHGKIVSVFGISIDITKIHQLQPPVALHNQCLKNILSAHNTLPFKNKLSIRQSECLYYLVRGMSAKQIAKILNLSHRTVEDYIESLKNKLNCDAKSELISTTPLS